MKSVGDPQKKALRQESCSNGLFRKGFRETLKEWGKLDWKGKEAKMVVNSHPSMGSAEGAAVEVPPQGSSFFPPQQIPASPFPLLTCTVVGRQR